MKDPSKIVTAVNHFMNDYLAWKIENLRALQRMLKRMTIISRTLQQRNALSNIISHQQTRSMVKHSL